MQTDLFTKQKTYTLRPYQLEAAEQGVWNLKNYGKPFFLVLATGAGKSLVIAEMCHQLDEPVLILQPSKEILEQNYNKLLSYGVKDVSIYSASMNSKEISKYTYATINSIYRKPEKFKHFKYVIIDECHGVNPKNLKGMYSKFLKNINCNRVCGLTATPYRLEQKYAKENGELFYTSHLKMINRIHPFFFKKMAYKIETADLIDMGYLSPIAYRMPHAIDLSELEVNSTGRDFTEESLERFYSDDRLMKIASNIQKIDKHCQGNLMFASSIRQANRMKDMLSVMGIEAEMVTGDTPKKERERLVEEFRDQKFKHMVNVGVFTVGFDVPHLDCITLARPTMSLALYYQMVGRGVRKDPERPDKVLRVYDFAGVVNRLGRVETIRLGKEDGFKDIVTSEAGRMDDVPLFKFKVKNKKTQERMGL